MLDPGRVAALRVDSPIRLGMGRSLRRCSQSFGVGRYVPMTAERQRLIWRIWTPLTEPVMAVAPNASQGKGTARFGA